MYSLIIDACYDYLEIGLIKNNIIIDVMFQKLNKNFTKVFNPFIDEILLKNNLSYSYLQNLYIINGPGSFTSIKLVSLFANTLKFCYKNLNLFSLDSLKWNITKINEISFLDAKSNLFYVSSIYFNTPLLIKKDDIKNIDNRFHKYIYSIENKKSIYEKWESNKNLFISNEFIRPLYIKPAIYDNNK